MNKVVKTTNDIVKELKKRYSIAKQLLAKNKWEKMDCRLLTLYGYNDGKEFPSIEIRANFDTKKKEDSVSMNWIRYGDGMKVPVDNNLDDIFNVMADSMEGFLHLKCKWDWLGD